MNIHPDLMGLVLDRPICDFCGLPIDVEELGVEWLVNFDRKGATGRPLLEKLVFLHESSRVCASRYEELHKLEYRMTGGACYGGWPKSPSPFMMLDELSMYDFDDPALYAKLVRGLLSANFEVWSNSGRCREEHIRARAVMMANMTDKLKLFGQLENEGLV